MSPTPGTHVDACFTHTGVPVKTCEVSTRNKRYTLWQYPDCWCTHSGSTPTAGVLTLAVPPTARVLTLAVPPLLVAVVRRGRGAPRPLVPRVERRAALEHLALVGEREAAGRLVRVPLHCQHCGRQPR